MKRVFLVMFVSALLATFGFAQTPDAGSNTPPASVKGCLGGSDGNFTVVEDGTGQIFKITSSTVDLKPHVGHDVKLVGHKATGAVSSGAADNSFSVSELSMISEHCGAAAAASAAVVTPSPETVIAPDPAAAAAPATPAAPAVDAAAPAATVSPAPATASTPPVDAAPAAAAIPPEPAVSAPVVEAVPPAPTVSPAVAPASPLAVEAARPERPSTHARKLSAKKAVAAAAPEAAVSPSSDTVVPEAAEAATPAVVAPAPSSEPATPPDAVAPAPTATHRAGSLTLLIGFVVLVIVLGTTAPLIGWWRKRKMLERDGSPNLSFTNEESTSGADANEVAPKEASSDPGKPEPRKVA